MHMERQVVLARVSAELLEPVARTGANGVGGDTDARAAGTKLFELLEVLGDRSLPEPLAAPARICDIEEHDLDRRIGGRLDRSPRLVQAEVVELAHRRVPGVTKLFVDRDVLATDLRGGLCLGELEHRVAPRPEV